MRVLAVLIILPAMLQVLAQPTIDVTSIPNEGNCIKMSDTKTAEINQIVQELSDFIDKIADKHEDLDLRLIKLDIDKRNEANTGDDTTVLEVFVNNCAQKVEYNNYSFENYEDNDENINDSHLQDSFNEDIDSEVNVENSMTFNKTNKRNQIRKQTRRDKVKNFKTTTTNRRARRKSQSANINYVSDVESATKNSTTDNVIKNNYESVSNSGVNNKHNFQSTSDSENTNKLNKISSNNISKTNENLSINNIRGNAINTQSTKNYKITNNYSQNESSTNINQISNELSTNNILNTQLNENIENNFNQLNVENKRQYKDNTIIVNDIIVEDKQTITNINNEYQTITNNENINNDKSSVDEDSSVDVSTYNNVNSESYTKEESSFSDEETTSDKETSFLNDNYYTSKSNNENYIKTSLSENKLLRSLRNFIREEVVTLTNKKNLQNIQKNVRGTNDVRGNDYINKRKFSNDWELKSRPQLVYLDLDDDTLKFLDDVERRREKKTPWLVHIKERPGQRQLIFM